MDLNLNLNVICRICLSDGDMRALDAQIDGCSYKDKILQCTNIQLKSHTDFPEQICSKCVDDLETAYRFRMNCESSDAILTSYIVGHHQVKQEFDEIEGNDYFFEDEPDNDDNEADNDNNEADNDNNDEGKVVSPKVQKKSKPKAIRKSRRKKPEKIQEEPTEKPTRSLSKQNQICEICGSQCRSAFEMRIHMRRHKGEKPFQCDFCEKKFACFGGLKVHLRTHTGEKPYPCQYCERKFADFTTRIKHERTHTGERPYSCSHCGKSFSYSHVLANHVMTHTGEKKFYCAICGKGFVKRHNLKIHQNVHLREQGKPTVPHKKKKQQPETIEGVFADVPAELTESIVEVSQEAEVSIEEQVQVVEVKSNMVYDINCLDFK